MKTQKCFYEIEEENQYLTRVKVHEGNNHNAYSKEALIGFDHFEQMYDIAEENDYEVVELEMKNGWESWKLIGNAYEDYDLYKKYWENTNEKSYEYFLPSDYKNEKDFFESEVKARLGKFDTIDEIRIFINLMEKAWKTIEEEAEKDEIVVVDFNYEEVSTDKRFKTRFDDGDGTIYYLGIIDTKEEEE